MPTFFDIMHLCETRPFVDLKNHKKEKRITNRNKHEFVIIL